MERTYPAAVTWPVRNLPKWLEASRTALYPAIFAIELKWLHEHGHPFESKNESPQCIENLSARNSGYHIHLPNHEFNHDYGPRAARAYRESVGFAFRKAGDNVFVLDRV